MTDRVAALWQGYVDTLPPEHPHRHARPDAFAFGDSPAMADELAALVRAGRKRARAISRPDHPNGPAAGLVARDES